MASTVLFFCRHGELRKDVNSQATVAAVDYQSAQHLSMSLKLLGCYGFWFCSLSISSSNMSTFSAASASPERVHAPIMSR